MVDTALELPDAAPAAVAAGRDESATFEGEDTTPVTAAAPASAAPALSLLALLAWPRLRLNEALSDVAMPLKNEPMVLPRLLAEGGASGAWPSGDTTTCGCGPSATRSTPAAPVAERCAGADDGAVTAAAALPARRWP